MFYKQKSQPGFTLIELLLVIAIIGLLATLAVTSLNNARIKSRDSRRLGDVRNIQTALELYFNDLGGYPSGTIGGVVQDGALGVDPRTSLSSANGFNSSVSGSTYMAKIQANPSPGGSDYVYSSDGSTYTITFTLESPSGGLSSGVHSGVPNYIR
ncbi:type II secretion system protein [Candidatus Kuenenbacteria bacterium]|nr:type II secretion system protein [Candidatus Kuenenbacteria bacterium]